MSTDMTDGLVLSAILLTIVARSPRSGATVPT